MANRIDPPVGDPKNAGRGLTYPVEIEGVLRALRDPSVIPCDGSTAVTVVTFNEEAQVRVGLAQINSAADAETIATIVERLKCSDLGRPIDACPSGDTYYDNAILAANEELKRRQGVRRVFLMSTDGGPNDQHKGVVESNLASAQAMRDQVQCELDVILMGLNTEMSEISDEESEFNRNKEKVNRIVFPAPTNGLPGATFSIRGGVSNKPGASTTGEDATAIREDFDCQADEFTRITRRVLRSDVSTNSLVVRTDADTEPDTLPSANEGLSLRQAIEQANCNSGAATITFADNVKIIHPLIPLPALTAPDITIDGIPGCDMQTDSTICDCDVKSDIIICACDGQNCAPSAIDAKNCAPSVTIDGTQTDTAKGEQHCDGILIRSNHDIVRGVKIINFTRAGVAIDPVCQSDIVGHNRVEGNTLENNKVAGVLVLDAPSNQANAVIHNLGNTILGNTILDSLDCAMPIDLDGDGRTDNDLCDTDEGPNTLLNFARIIAVTQSASNVTVTGSVCDPNCAAEVCPTSLIGAVVEVFAVTRFGTGCAALPANGETALHFDSDHRVITGVRPLARGTIGSDGSFSISDVGISPTCGYTATVTDTEGNTSELTFPCAGFAKANLDTFDISFSPDAVPNGQRLSATFQVENQGCAPLSLVSFSFKRDGFPGGHKKRRDDDSAHFSIKSPTIGPNGITIEPGQAQRFTVEFDPAIPRCLLSGERLRAADTLPSTIVSSLTLNHNGCGATTSTINLIARVTTEVHLIDAQNPQEPPLVTLTRSGDELLASFAVFDSNRDVQKAKYELLDGAGRAVPLDNCCVDLTEIQNRYVAGQSFGIFQEFFKANRHPEVAAIRVTVFDKDGSSDTSTSSQIAISKHIASAPSLGHKQTGTLILSSTKAAPVLHKRTQSH
jgi:hypothetical protein